MHPYLSVSQYKNETIVPINNAPITAVPQAGNMNGATRNGPWVIPGNGKGKMVNPITKLETNNNIPALIATVNNPIVAISIGSAKAFKIGLISKLTPPKTSVMVKSVLRPPSY